MQIPIFQYTWLTSHFYLYIQHLHYDDNDDTYHDNDYGCKGKDANHSKLSLSSSSLNLRFVSKTKQTPWEDGIKKTDNVEKPNKETK